MGNNNPKVIIVTGAGKGLGAAYAKYLSLKGYKIIVNNRISSGQIDSAQKIANEINKSGGSAISNQSDLRDPNAPDEIFDLAINTFGSIDCLINNAGISEGKTFHKASIEELMTVVEVNLIATMKLTHKIYKYMYEKGKGNIIFTTSAAGLYGQHGMPAYSSSKAGIIGLANSLHLESFKKDIAVNIISPFAHTNMTKSFMNSKQAKKFAPEKILPIIDFIILNNHISGNIFICGGGKFRLGKFYENDGLDFSSYEDFSYEELETRQDNLFSMKELKSRKNASESFEDL